ncbi:phosphohydrolase [Mycoplasma ovis str. Michigan]|uniref:Phosphohydrolase n=1 Tax=Mycoplasma ovis str. Michigan TaxID=1415773 RepID=A0ABN4BPN4_9MOLU|nr:phosphohydrolase [Mycoplasma ovis str. Michigan]
MVYPEVLKTLSQHFKIEEVVYYKRGLSQDIAYKKLVLFRKQVELQLSLIDPFISVEFREIPQDQDIKDPKKFKEYIESVIQSEYSDLPKEEIAYLIETLAINHIKLALENISNSWNFLLFTNKHKGNLDLSLGSQNWKRIHMVRTEAERTLMGAIKRVHKEQSDPRFDHTIRVLKFANQIANWSSMDPVTKNKLLLSCAYHDFAKDWTKDKLLQLASRMYSKPKQELENEIWNLHGPVARNYLSKAFRLDDSVLTAIEHHTKPIADLDIIGKSLVVADKLEPLKKDSYPQDKYDSLMEQLKKGKIEEVFKYLLENPIKS